MMCSCSSGEWQTTCRPFALRLLLHPHVLGEIIVGGMVAFVDLHAARAVIAWVEHALEKRELQRPSGFRLRTAITARHGVVEPAVRRTGVDLDRNALSVSVRAVGQGR